ncbi:MAG: glycogen synthase GlgA [Calditrichales bacterium]|nr:MAG: glycogen synthase GlgA [Calditrichales bacterium]
MDQYKVWYLASEVSPFAKTGGLGDVTGAFPKALKNANQEVRVIMPKYKSINERKYILREVIRLKEIPVTINGVTRTINVKSAFLPDSKVQIYFIEIPELYGRSGLYTDSGTGKDFEDNAERFAFFCKGALETLKILSWRPDIIHCNDWQTALAPYYLKTMYKDDEFLHDIKTVFTIHNFSYQGIFDKDIASNLEIAETDVNEGSAFEHSGNLNLMKGAITYSDVITTVSEAYAGEILSNPKFSYGLEKILQEKKDQFAGVINGVDYSVWSPGVDKFLPFKYSDADMAGKEQNKQALLSRVNMEYSENTPVIGMISRIVEQKGYGILMDVMDELMGLNVQLVMLGTGDSNIEEKIQAFQKKYPKQISLNQAFDETLAHMIEAGSDMFLMPSDYEPCGMNQMYSLKYGTIPVVNNVGGLKETITDYDMENKTGNGFVMQKYSGKELIRTIKRALKLYKKKEDWSELQVSAMQEDFSWDKSSEKYLDLYTALFEK